MAKFVDYDPARGMATYEDMYDGKLQVHYREDVEPLIELAKHERINGLADTTARKKEDMRLYARIPAVVIMELRFKHGIDIFDKNDFKKAVEMFNREYPYLKCTDMHHTVTN